MVAMSIGIATTYRMGDGSTIDALPRPLVLEDYAVGIGVATCISGTSEERELIHVAGVWTVDKFDALPVSIQVRVLVGTCSLR